MFSWSTEVFQEILADLKKNGLVSSQIKSSAVVPLTINLEQMFLENITCETLLTPVQGEAVNTSSFLFYFHFFVFFFKLLLSWGGTFLSGRWIIPEGDNSRHQWQEQHRRARGESSPFNFHYDCLFTYLIFQLTCVQLQKCLKYMEKEKIKN